MPPLAYLQSRNQYAPETEPRQYDSGAPDGQGGTFLAAKESELTTNERNTCKQKQFGTPGCPKIRAPQAGAWSDRHALRSGCAAVPVPQLRPQARTAAVS